MIKRFTWRLLSIAVLAAIVSLARFAFAGDGATPVVGGFDLDQIAGLIGAAGALVAMLHVLTSLDLVSKIEMGGLFSAFAGPTFTHTHNYLAAAAAGIGAVTYALRQRYKTVPGTIALPEYHPAAQEAQKIVARNPVATSTDDNVFAAPDRK